MSDYKLDRSAFKKQTFKEAETVYGSGKDLTYSERLQQGYFLSLQAYGYSLENQPKLDRTYFTCRKFPK